ncbi:hypothetical protein KAH81_05160 [bacterium]|nr:hypothetical protein [bacterium]
MFKKGIVFFLLLVGTVILAQQVEPFTAGEGAAIEIYETALPLLEACEILIEDINEIEMDFKEIKSIAKDQDIDLDPIEEEIIADPNMTRWAISALELYSKDNLALSESAEEPDSKTAFFNAGLTAYKQAAILDILISTWAPDEEGE